MGSLMKATRSWVTSGTCSQWGATNVASMRLHEHGMEPQHGLDGEIFGQLESHTHGACVRGDFSRVSTSSYAELDVESCQLTLGLLGGSTNVWTPVASDRRCMAHLRKP